MSLKDYKEVQGKVYLEIIEEKIQELQSQLDEMKHNVDQDKLYLEKAL